MSEIKEKIEQLLNETEKIIIGKRHETKLLITALMSDGHVLIDDVPGTGKTTLVKIIAAMLGYEFRRMQFVSDLMPGMSWE